MSAFSGRVLLVDLTTRATDVQELDAEIFRRYLGGVGLATRLLFDHMPPGVDPLGPENVLAFATSPLAASLVPTGSKFVVATKSPLTGFLGDSISSSYWAAALKQAGYEALVVRGRAEKPTYVFIDDDHISFVDAAHLWGKGSYATEEQIQADLADPEVRVASIGPAGEKLVRFACITNDKERQLGRTGPGAVMGSKNLKAIAVRGTKPVRVADLERLSSLALDMNHRAQGMATAKYRIVGTPTNVLVLNRLGILPTRNFQEGTFSAAEQVSGEYMYEHHWQKTVACAACPIGCEQVVRVKNGQYEGAAVSLDYEPLFALGPCCGLDYFPAIIKAAEICDTLGMDSISAGVTVSWAMECYERGLITKEDTDGLELNFGNHEAMVTLIERIGQRQGFGDILAEGSRRAAAQIGGESERFAMQVKGLEMPGYDPRALKTYALGLAVGTRGGCHNRSAAYEPDIKGEVDRFTADRGRGVLAKRQEDFAATLDSAMFCKFLRGCFQDFYAEGAEFYEVTTGLDMTAEEFKQAGERVSNLKKAFNIREGWTRADDWLPARCLEEALPEGPSGGAVLTSDELEMMIDGYYEARGWTNEGMIPAEQLTALGLGDILEKEEATV